VNYAAVVKEHNKLGIPGGHDRLWPVNTSLEDVSTEVTLGMNWPDFWPEIEIKQHFCCLESHPPYPVHIYVADASASMISTLLANVPKATCIGTVVKASAPIALRDPLHSKVALAKFPTCKAPKSYYSSDGEQLVTPLVVSGDWRLYEDRKNKPGWIATKPSSTIQFSVTLSCFPTVGISYLRSYEGVGKVILRLFPKGKRPKLDDPFSCREEMTALGMSSWYHCSVINALDTRQTNAQTTTFSTTEAFGTDEVCRGRGLAEGGQKIHTTFDYVLEIQLLVIPEESGEVPEKVSRFKLVEVITC